MRILYFHQHFGTPQGSTGTRSYEFAKALVARGHRVTMVCGAFTLNGLSLPFDEERHWSRGDVEGIDVIALPLPYSNRDGLVKRALVFLKFAWRSTLLALKEDYDVLFATSTPLTAGIPGIVMKLLGRGKPFVFEVRDLWPELPRALGMKNPFALAGMSVLEWLSYRLSDACVGLSPGIVEGIRRRSRKDLPIAMIPNGCDLDLFHPSMRRELNLPGVGPGDFVAGFTGAHGIANGLDAVLDAGAELKRRGRKDIKIVLIGDGNQKDRLKKRSLSEGIDNVLFFPPVKKTEMARITASFDCGLMILANVEAFYYGTSPNKFFDYISAGIPVVNNYPGWLADLIGQNGCGIAVPPESASAFADALCLMADDPGRRGQMGQAGRRLAEREFNRAALADQFCRFLEMAAGGRKLTASLGFSGFYRQQVSQKMDQLNQVLLTAINRVRENKHQAALTDVSDDTRLREDCGFDSMDLAELTVIVEAESGVDLFADSPVRTVGDAIAKLTSHPKG